MLLHKKVTNCVTLLLFMENNALCYFYITFRGFLSVHIFFFNNKNPQSYIFGNCKGPFTLKMRRISLRVSYEPLLLHLTPNFSQHGVRRCVSEGINGKTKLLVLLIYKSNSAFFLQKRPLGGVSSYITNTGDRNLSDIIILICVLKMKACFMGLERHEG